jgi:hypothetical protein
MDFLLILPVVSGLTSRFVRKSLNFPTGIYYIKGGELSVSWRWDLYHRSGRGDLRKTGGSSSQTCGTLSAHFMFMDRSPVPASDWSRSIPTMPAS